MYSYTFFYENLYFFLIVSMNAMEHNCLTIMKGENYASITA